MVISSIWAKNHACYPQTNVMATLQNVAGAPFKPCSVTMNCAYFSDSSLYLIPFFKESPSFEHFGMHACQADSKGYRTRKSYTIMRLVK